MKQMSLTVVFIHGLQLSNLTMSQLKNQLRFLKLYGSVLKVNADITNALSEIKANDLH